MPTGKMRAVIAIVAGVFILLIPQAIIYLIGLALIAFGVNEIFPELKNQVRDYFRGRPRDL
ncbi:MAG: DUF3096 domain-containing protein [Hyphomicrobiales bacterium]|nr:DUF3096 domain-containing protein [Hyphomicrobiales bacterium]